MRGVKKEHLPEKLCATCGRPFAWRKKWARDWVAVKHCSDACRMRKGNSARGILALAPLVTFALEKTSTMLVV